MKGTRGIGLSLSGPGTLYHTPLPTYLHTQKGGGEDWETESGRERRSAVKLGGY